MIIKELRQITFPQLLHHACINPLVKYLTSTDLAGLYLLSWSKFYFHRKTSCKTLLEIGNNMIGQDHPKQWQLFWTNSLFQSSYSTFNITDLLLLPFKKLSRSYSRKAHKSFSSLCILLFDILNKGAVSSCYSICSRKFW